MVFSSQVFLWYFLPLALAVYYAARLGPRWLGHGLLVLLRWAFYGWANPPFVLLLAMSTAVDFACGWWVARSQPGARSSGGELPLCPPGGERSRAQRLAVAVSVCTNLGVLGDIEIEVRGLSARLRPGSPSRPPPLSSVHSRSCWPRTIRSIRKPRRSCSRSWDIT